MLDIEHIYRHKALCLPDGNCIIPPKKVNYSLAVKQADGTWLVPNPKFNQTEIEELERQYPGIQLGDEWKEIPALPTSIPTPVAEGPSYFAIAAVIGLGIVTLAALKHYFNKHPEITDKAKDFSSRMWTRTTQLLPERLRSVCCRASIQAAQDLQEIPTKSS